MELQITFNYTYLKQYSTLLPLSLPQRPKGTFEPVDEIISTNTFELKIDIDATQGPQPCVMRRRAGARVANESLFKWKVN